MRAIWRVLILSAWLGVAGASAATAQTDSLAGRPDYEACGAICRFFGNAPQTPPQPAPPAASQAEVEPEADRSRRPRRNANRRAPQREAAEAQSVTGGAKAEPRPRARAAERAPAKAARRAPSPSDDVEQTASVGQDTEVLFVSGADEAHRAIAGDLAAVLAPDLTVRTTLGRGMPIQDVLTVPGADVTVTSSLTLARGTAYADRVVYLAKLFTEELHAIAGPGLTRLEDLEGKPVHLGPPNSDSEAAARALLQSRGVAVTPVGGSFADALAGLREGRVAAAFVLAPKPFAQLSDLPAADGLRLLPLAYRPSDAAFYPAALSAADYPGLIEAGGRVETVALDAVLVAPRWRDNTARQRELTAFTTRLFERLDRLGGPGRHAKWRETNLATGIDGFRRLRSAEQWVAARLKAREAGAGRSLPAGRIAGAAP